MSDSRQQVWIDAPVEVVWELIANVNRHPEWWPRIVDVECDELAEGCTYKEVVSSPVGKDEMELEIERLDDCEELAVRCINTGTFVQFALTEAQGGTFVDGRMGMDPQGIVTRVFDTIIGQRYFRAWLTDSLASMRRACEGLAARGSTADADRA